MAKKKQKTWKLKFNIPAKCIKYIHICTVATRAFLFKATEMMKKKKYTNKNKLFPHALHITYLRILYYKNRDRERNNERSFSSTLN